jgi:hypothetical protein
MPELRSMTVPLTEQLDVEVEPLDSLFGVDAAHLPTPVEEFRERGAELRLAWAVAADWPPPINLLRARNRQASKAMLARAAVVTGTAAGLVVGWRVQQSPWWRAAAPAPVRTAADARPGGRGSTPAVAGKTAVVPPPVVANKAPAVTPSPAATSNVPGAAPPPAVVANRPPAVPSPAAVASRPAVTPPESVVSTAPRVASPATSPVRPLPPRARARTAPPPNVPVAFDAVLGTILYSPDRKLAIVDGRIVGLGDEIRGARIVDITPNTVMLRDTEGRLRRIALGAGGR